MPYDFSVRIRTPSDVATFARKRGWAVDGADLEHGGVRVSVRFDATRGAVRVAGHGPAVALDAATRERILALDATLLWPRFVVRDGRIELVAHAVLDDDDAISELTLDRLVSKAFDETATLRATWGAP